MIVYVDDLIVTTPGERALAAFKRGHQSHFDMRDFRSVMSFLNVAIERREKSYVLSQKGYVDKTLNVFLMQACKPVSTPLDPACYATLTERRELSAAEIKEMENVPYRKLVVMLLYLSTHTCPDIAFATGIVALHMAAPREIHWLAVLRHLRVTSYIELHLSGGDLRLTAYADADWAGESDRHSVTGNVVFLGAAPIVWRSVKQSCTALSTTEAEYVSLSSVARDVHWLR